MPGRDITLEVTLRPGAAPPHFAGAKFVKTFPGERDSDLKRQYLVYVDRDAAQSLLAKIRAHPAIESAKAMPTRRLIR